MNRWLTNGFFALLAILAGSTAYFATKATVLEDHLARRGLQTGIVTPSPTNDLTTPTPATTTATATPSGASPTTSSLSPVSAAPTALALADRLSQPSETYTVVAGDTLYPLSLKNNMTLERLAEANGLLDPYKLTIGQILVIPEVNAKQNLFEVRFTTDPSRAAQWQTKVTGGSDAWRLSPKEVAKAESAGAFGLASSDDYQEKTRDDVQGTAVVLVSRLVGNQTKIYQVTLTQPATKGAAGLWSITKIAPQAA